MGLPETSSDETLNQSADKPAEIPYRFAREHNVLLTSVEDHADKRTATAFYQLWGDISDN